MSDLEKVEQSRLASGRSCGPCSLCCKLLPIFGLPKPKPRGQWCPHCKPGRGGCVIYESRPEECRIFYCGWLMGHLPPEWYPQHSKMVVAFYPRPFGVGSDCLVTVDPAYAGRWREEPYYSQIKQNAVSWLTSNTRTFVRIGTQVIAVFPSSDVDLGEVEMDKPLPADRAAAMQAALEREMQNKNAASRVSTGWQSGSDLR
jgi:hypothetical protein